MVLGVLFALALSLVTAALVARGLPPVIAGLKKWLIVFLVGAVNFALALLVFSGDEANARLKTEDDPDDETGATAPAIIRGYAFSDPDAVVVAAVLIGIGGVALMFPLGLAGGARFAIGAALFMLPGYLLSVLLMPKSLGIVGRLLFSAALSAAVAPTVAQILYWMGFLFTTWIALVATLGVSMLLLVVFRFAQKRR